METFTENQFSKINIVFLFFLIHKSQIDIKTINGHGKNPLSTIEISILCEREMTSQF